MLSRRKETSWPKVSVVIPTYNRSTLVGKAIKSVLGQTFKDLELIVVNDGSTDETERVLEASRRKDHRFNYVTINNSDRAAARNAGIKLSRGQYLAFLDDDDWWARDKLVKQLKLFKTSRFKKNLGLVYCWHYWVDAQGNKTGQLQIGKRGDVFPEIIKGNMICGSGSAALVKRGCFEKLGLFNEKFKLAEDWEMWIRITNHYTVDFVPELLIYVNRWPKRSFRYMLRLFWYNVLVDLSIIAQVMTTTKRRSWRFLGQVTWTRIQAEFRFLWTNVVLRLWYLSPLGYFRRLLYLFYRSKRLKGLRETGKRLFKSIF